MFKKDIDLLWALLFICLKVHCQIVTTDDLTTVTFLEWNQCAIKTIGKIQQRFWERENLPEPGMNPSNVWAKTLSHWQYLFRVAISAISCLCLLSVGLWVEPMAVTEATNTASSNLDSCFYVDCEPKEFVVLEICHRGWRSCHPLI